MSEPLELNLDPDFTELLMFECGAVAASCRIKSLKSEERSEIVGAGLNAILSRSPESFDAPAWPGGPNIRSALVRGLLGVGSPAPQWEPWAYNSLRDLSHAAAKSMVRMMVAILSEDDGSAKWWGGDDEGLIDALVDGIRRDAALESPKPSPSMMMALHPQSIIALNGRAKQCPSLPDGRPCESPVQWLIERAIPGATHPDSPISWVSMLMSVPVPVASGVRLRSVSMAFAAKLFIMSRNSQGWLAPDMDALLSRPGHASIRRLRRRMRSGGISWLAGTEHVGPWVASALGYRDGPSGTASGYFPAGVVSAALLDRLAMLSAPDGDLTLRSCGRDILISCDPPSVGPLSEKSADRRMWWVFAALSERAKAKAGKRGLVSMKSTARGVLSLLRMMGAGHDSQDWIRPLPSGSLPINEWLDVCALRIRYADENAGSGSGLVKALLQSGMWPEDGALPPETQDRLRFVELLGMDSSWLRRIESPDVAPAMCAAAVKILMSHPLPELRCSESEAWLLLSGVAGDALRGVAEALPNASPSPAKLNEMAVAIAVLATAMERVLSEFPPQKKGSVNHLNALYRAMSLSISFLNDVRGVEHSGSLSGGADWAHRGKNSVMGRRKGEISALVLLDELGAPLRDRVSPEVLYSLAKSVLWLGASEMHSPDARVYAAEDAVRAVSVCPEVHEDGWASPLIAAEPPLADPKVKPRLDKVLYLARTVPSPRRPGSRRLVASLAQENGS